MSAKDKFLEQIKKQLDENQYKAVTSEDSCVVTSGAGSGKTTVLSYRFLNLVVQNRAHSDEILTLTFSRYAAGEMFIRIQEKLNEFKEFSEIREEIGRLRDATITTIDAFCHRVVLGDLKSYGLGSDFTLDDEANKKMASDCAKSLIKKEKTHPGLLYLTTIVNPDQLVETLLGDLAKEKFCLTKEFSAKENYETLIKKVKILCLENLKILIDGCRAITGMVVAGKVFGEASENAQIVLDHQQELFNLADAKEHIRFLDEIRFRVSTTKSEAAQIYNSYADILNKEFLDTLKLQFFYLSEQNNIREVYTFLELYYRLYAQEKRKTGVLTFRDVANLALDILLKNKKVRTYFKNRFKYILIDEFQDTNELQKQIIYFLAEDTNSSSDTFVNASDLTKGKLFFVGDEKQSIYRFRGADVSVFKKVAHEAKEFGGQYITLKTNYRSEPLLIEFFNKVFEKVMQESENPWDATFSALTSRDAIKDLKPKISFYYKGLAEEQQEVNSDEQEAENAAAEAHAIAHLIQSMVYEDEYLISDNNTVRRPKYGEIAILIRTTSNQRHFEKALRKEGIPYNISAIQTLFLESPANDLFLFLQLVLYPQDKSAFTAILRSPFCRVSDDLLFKAVENFNIAFEEIGSKDYDRGELEKYNSAKKLYEKVCELSKTESIASLLSYLWYEGSYRYHFLKEKSFHPYLEHFDFLFDLAVEFDKRGDSLSLFLDFLRVKMGTNERLDDIEPLRDESDGVKLMTAHKSKGLQFPIVIVGSMGTATKNIETPNYYSIDSFFTPSLNFNNKKRNVMFELEKEKILSQETAEMKRLFYVALTRATTHLVLSGYGTTKNLGPNAHNKNFLALFNKHTSILEDPSALGEEFELEEILPIAVSDTALTVNKKEIEKRVEKIKTNYRNIIKPFSFKNLSIAVTEISRVDTDEKTSLGYPLKELDCDKIIKRENLEKEFGIWTHAVLEALFKGENKKSVPLEEVLLLAPKEIKGGSITEKEFSVIGQSISDLVIGFINSDLYSELTKKKRVKTESEVAFSMRLENNNFVVNGVIDLLVHYEDELIILDFKTDSYRNESLYENQLYYYSQFCRRYYKVGVRSALCYLRETQNIRWITTD